MRVITPQDRENAKRLKGIWDRKKTDLGLTQAKAAEMLGYAGQGAVGQYLNCHIALNYEAVISFAKLLRVEPWEIDPSLGTLNLSEVNDRERYIVPVTHTLSREKDPSKTSTTTRYDYPAGQCYGIEIDREGYRPYAKRGATIVVCLAEKALPGDDIIITQLDGTLVLAELVSEGNDSVTVVHHSSRVEESLPLSNIKSIDPIVEMCLPLIKRPHRLHAVG